MEARPELMYRQGYFNLGLFLFPILFGLHRGKLGTDGITATILGKRSYLQTQQRLFRERRETT